MEGEREREITCLLAFVAFVVGGPSSRAWERSARTRGSARGARSTGPGGPAVKNEKTS